MGNVSQQSLKIRFRTTADALDISRDWRRVQSRANESRDCRNEAMRVDSRNGKGGNLHSSGCTDSGTRLRITDYDEHASYDHSNAGNRTDHDDNILDLSLLD